MTATTQRPAWYDAKIVEFQPFMRKVSNRYVRRPDDDLVQDIAEETMKLWRHYDEKYKFGTWIALMARNVIRARHRSFHQRKNACVTVQFKDEYSSPIPANQLDYAELSAVLRNLSGTRDSEALMRVAMGDEYHEIAKDMGVSKQRVHQLVERERARLVAA